MNIKKHIPNFITCCNLLCGCIGIIESFQAHLTTAAYMIFIACVFDFFDGFAARALKVSSPIGKDLDSLSDMVTFGVLPGLILFHLLDVSFHYTVMVGLPEEVKAFNWKEYVPLLALLIPVFSALRLAKFNNDTRQSDRFIGMPTPANALFIASLGILYESKVDDFNFHLFVHPATIISLIVLIFILSGLLVAELPLIALKFKNFNWADNKIRYILIISSLLLLLTLNFMAIPIIIILYIILSIIENTLLGAKGKS
jgi:CDP-diacylglycerol---serine O-phosphatidyltransferase